MKKDRVYYPFYYREVTEISENQFHLSLYDDYQHHLWCRRPFKSEKRAHNFAARFCRETLGSYSEFCNYADESLIQAFDKHFIYVEDYWVIYQEWLIQTEESISVNFTITLNDPLGATQVMPVVRDEIFLEDESIKSAFALIDRIEFSRSISPNQLSLF